MDLVKEKMQAQDESNSDLHSLLKKVKMIIKSWNKEFNGNIFQKLKEVEEELAK